jgi:hypothetical protein
LNSSVVSIPFRRAWSDLVTKASGCSASPLNVDEQPSPARAGEGTGVRARRADPRLAPWATRCRPLRGLNSSTNF